MPAAQLAAPQSGWVWGPEPIRAARAGAYRLATLDRLVAMWQLNMDLAEEANAEGGIEGIGGAQGTYFVADWFPVLDHRESMFLAYDAAPAKDGVVGQLVMVDPDRPQSYLRFLSGRRLTARRYTSPSWRL